MVRFYHKSYRLSMLCVQNVCVERANFDRIFDDVGMTSKAPSPINAK